MKRLISSLVILTIIVIGISLGIHFKKDTPPPSKASLIKTWGKMPIYFVENQGQTDPRVGYYVKGGEKTLYFGSEGLTVSIHQTPKAEVTNPLSIQEATASTNWNVKLLFEGTNEGIRPEGVEKTETKVSYFKGAKKDWKTGIDTYRSIAYRELWSGVDVVYSGNMDLLKQDFVVRPGSDPAKIRLAYLGADSVTLTDDGAMDIGTPLGGFRDEKPSAYQVIDGKKVAVDVAYDLVRKGDRHEYGFRMGRYDPAKELIIDPAVVIYAGFIGGSGTDKALGIAVDGDGNAYVVGQTSSTEATFPVKGGPDLTYNGGAYDAFVAKVKTDGSGLVYAGFIGGSGSESGSFGIAVDGDGNVYMSGWTSSTEATFPVVGGPHLTQNGGTDAFVVKVNSAGTGLVYSGFIGGSGDDYGLGIAVDGDGNAYVVGQTNSTEATATPFPLSGGPDLTQNGGWDTFVAKVKADGTGLVYSGFIGGSGNDYGYGIALDGGGNAYVSGYTASADGTFPDGDGFGAVVGPDQTYNGGTYDAFVAKVNPAGTGLVYSGFVGGSEDDFCFGIAVDGRGNAYMVGYTASTEATATPFPLSGGPDLTYNGGVYDAFVAKVNPTGTGLVYSGFIGGSGEDQAGGIAVDGAGNAYVEGYTKSTEATFPVMGGPDLTRNDNGSVFDAFVAKVKADGTGLDYAGFIGGSGVDYGIDIAIDGDGNAYVTGYTASSDGSFHVTAGSLDTSYNGGAYDAFVTKITIVPVCGDGVVEGTEECDNAGANSDSVPNACRTDCKNSSCGDGVADTGEGCDDGNAVNTDSCTNACALPTCGDGYVQSGEACDDGNSSNTDSCLNTCVAASCGDGFVETGTEGCDDDAGQNGQPNQCNSECSDITPSVCGNRVKEEGETCDDGNTEDGDGCNHACGVEVSESGTNAIGAANPDFDWSFKVREPSKILIAPDPRNHSAGALKLKDAELLIGCSCAWSLIPESIGTLNNAISCATNMTPAEAGEGTLEVSVDCGAEGSGDYRQAVTVSGSTTSTAGNTGAGGCSLVRQ